MRGAWIFLGLVFLAWGSLSAGADVPLGPATGSQKFKDFSELSLDELLNQVVVTAARQEQPLSVAPVTMHVISEEEIRRSPAQTLSDLLRLVPGFQVKTWLSEFTNTSLRGMVGASVINERIMWMIDGVPVNDVRDGGIWTDITLPLANIKRIEVLSGPGSALYGSNAFVGVVHIITRDPDDLLKLGRTGEFQTHYSTYSTLVNNLTVAGTTKKTKWLWSGDFASTEGPGLVRDRMRPNEEKHSDRKWGWVRGKYQWGRNRLNLGMRSVDQDYDGAEFTTYRRYTWKRGERWLDWHTSADRRNGAHDSMVLSWHGFTEHFYDFADVPGLEYDINSLRWHINLQRDQQRNRHQISYGTGLRSESYNGDDFYPNRRDILKNNLNLFFQDEWKLASQWTLTWGGRYDTHPNYASVFSPHLSLSWMFPNRKGKIRVTGGSAFKEPSNWQSFIDQPSGMGNPNMQPEKVTSGEVAVEYTFPRELFTRAVYYQLKHRNIIWESFDPAVADPFYKATYGIAGKFHPQQPGDSAKIEGLEWELKKRFSPRTNAWAQAVFLRSRDNLERDLEYDAHRKLGAGIWHSFNSRLSMQVESYQVGETIDTSLRNTPVDPTNPAGPKIGVRNVPSYSLAGASMMLKLSSDELFKISAWNIGRGIYQEMLGVPVPGTTVRFSFFRSF